MGKILFSALLICLAMLSVSAQISTRNPRMDKREDMRLRREQQQELRSLEKRNLHPNGENKSLMRVQISNDLKQLDLLSDNLLQVIKLNNRKDAAELADKIAKLSKKLRQELNLNEPKRKIEPLPIPPDLDHQKQLNQLAELISKLTDQVNESQSTNVVNAALVQQTGEQLVTIENQAMTLRAFARSKN